MMQAELIVIGCSAGGLKALCFLLEDLNLSRSIPIIIVQHRISDNGELLEEVLSKKINRAVTQASEKEAIAPGGIYTAPPGYHLLLEKDRTFSISYDPPVNFSRPSIDVLFESAAWVYQQRLIGILLTGASSDGALGIRAIKEFGGITLVQDPAEAMYAAMPAAALATGHVDYVFSLEKIKTYLSRLA
jgi:two-component system, chemotaxis family, protein-glutamate methylesterase/glutaminase